MPISLGGFPLPGHGFGLGLLLRLDADSVPVEYSWSGMASTFFWIQPRGETIVIVLQQVEPLDIGLLLALRPLIEASITE